MPMAMPSPIEKVNGIAINRNKRGQRFAGRLPIDFAHIADHHRAHEYQCRSCDRRIGTNKLDERGEEHRGEKAARRKDGRQSGASARLDTGGRFHVAGHRGGTQARAANRARGIGGHRAADVRQLAVLDQACFLRDADERANRVEHVDEQEHDHKRNDPHIEHTGEIELKERRCQRRRRGKPLAGPVQLRHEL